MILMSSVELGYGRGRISFVDGEGRFQILAPADETALPPLSDAQLGALIDDPFDSQTLEEIISPNESVLIVVSDATRATASGQVVNLLVRRLVPLRGAAYEP